MAAVHHQPPSDQLSAHTMHTNAAYPHTPTHSVPSISSETQPGAAVTSTRSGGAGQDDMGQVLVPESSCAKTDAYHTVPEHPLPTTTNAGVLDEVATGAEEEQSSMTSSGLDAKEMERLELQSEIWELESSIQGLSSHYKIIDRLGEGTFSSVYKAIDLQHSAYDNNDWVHRGPLDPKRRGVVHVALKKIYVTSSPNRILNELSIMEDLRPAEYVSYLITAFRAEDQIVAVMPYSRHSDFRDFFKIIPLTDLKCYFRCLFAALQSVHEAGIMHRDVKPANFLYDPTTGFGTLCDFGLAERFEPADWRGKCHHSCPTPELPHGKAGINRRVDSIHFEPGRLLASSTKTSSSTTAGAAGSTSSKTASTVAGGGGSTSGMDPPPERLGYMKNDPRQSVRANRAGTRGFRAPEVLFKCQDQTVSIDIWSAGVIMLTFLTKRFPIFNSGDDVDALLEISTIFGKKRMELCALLHNRTFHTNIPEIEESSGSLVEFILHLNPGLTDSSDHPNPEKYKVDVKNALNFVKCCLQLDCTKRWTAGQLLDHPFLLIDEEDVAVEEEEESQEQDEEYREEEQEGQEDEDEEEEGQEEDKVETQEGSQEREQQTMMEGENAYQDQQVVMEYYHTAPPTGVEAGAAMEVDDDQENHDDDEDGDGEHPEQESVVQLHRFRS